LAKNKEKGGAISCTAVLPEQGPGTNKKPSDKSLLPGMTRKRELKMEEVRLKWIIMHTSK
jgi:hypothetical protein